MDQFREISIDGCPEIGRGAHGIVYQTAPDMLVKVYNENTSTDSIRRERELARWAFVKGIPTAIPFDIVRVGDRYGIVFEHLAAKSPADYIRESPEHFESYLKRSVELMKQIHAIAAKPGELPDMKRQTLGWLPKVRPFLPDHLYSRLCSLVDAIPDRSTIIHADFHMNNILICGDELMLIDMDTLSTGDPIFELATVFVSYREFPSIEPKAAYMLGVDVETAAKICDRIFELYLDAANDAALQDAKDRAQLLGCVRIIDYVDRHAELPDREKCIGRCVQDITRLLQLRG
ncbi:MAG: hypothetical protein E7425_07085 [Ruminococcaceae bacterium]|nr:hypothetical protein [Oscillospiraceae bacterium]